MRLCSETGVHGGVSGSCCVTCGNSVCMMVWMWDGETLCVCDVGGWREMIEVCVYVYSNVGICDSGVGIV